MYQKVQWRSFFFFSGILYTNLLICIILIVHIIKIDKVIKTVNRFITSKRIHDNQLTLIDGWNFSQ